MVVPSGLGLPVLPWSRSRLRRGSGIRWTGIVSPLPVRPCPAPACNTGIGHRRAPGSPDIRRHPAISAGRLHAGCRRYRVRRVHARRHRYQAGRHASDIDSGSRGTRGLPISIPRPHRYRFLFPAADIDGHVRGHRYRPNASRALISVSGPADRPPSVISGRRRRPSIPAGAAEPSARLSWLPVEVSSLVDLPGYFA